MKRNFGCFLVCLAFLVGCNNSPPEPAPGPKVKINAPGVNIDIEGKRANPDTRPPHKGGVKIDVPGAKVDVERKNN